MKSKVIAIVGVLMIVGSAAVVLWVRSQRGFSARDEPSAPEAFVARLVRTLSIPAEAKRLEGPKRLDDPTMLTRARMHWADHCAICHANDGSGDTPMGRGLYPKAPDMRLPLTQSKSDGELFYIIENGIRLTGMPAWANGGAGEESWGLVGFIRSLPRLTPEDIKQLAAMNPKSALEAEEEADEEEFLRGPSPKQESPP